VQVALQLTAASKKEVGPLSVRRREVGCAAGDAIGAIHGAANYRLRGLGLAIK